jgi:hypothetical protein
MIASYNQRPFQVICSHCGIVYDLLINPEDLILWQAGTLIQECMDYLTAAERELLISQTCDNCWKNLFGEEESYEDCDD